MKLCEENDARRMGVALKEAMLNAMLHGNLHGQPAPTLTPARAPDQGSPWTRSLCGDLRITVDVILSRKLVCFRVRDQGPGFDTKTLPDPRNPMSIELQPHRGYILMCKFMDEVVYNDKGNAVTLTRRLAAAADGGGENR